MKKFFLDKTQKEMFDKLSDENAGKLIKGIFEYIVSGKQLGIDSEIQIPFIVISKNIEKQKKVQEKRSEAGKKGMEKRWNIQTNEVEKKEITQTKKRTCFIAPTLEDVEKYIKEKQLNVNGKHFFEYFNEGNWVDSKGNKVRNWKQKLLTWNKYSTTKENTKLGFEKEIKNIDFENLYE